MTPFLCQTSNPYFPPIVMRVRGLQRVCRHLTLRTDSGRDFVREVAVTNEAGRMKVGISSCLLGEEVRYNGGHKLSRLCSDELSRYFEYVPLCPEVGIGMGVPRKPIRLVGDPDQPRAV